MHGLHRKHITRDYASVQAGMPGGAQGPLGMLRASQMVQQLLPGGQVPQMPQLEEEKKPQFIAELEINDFPQHARWKVCLRFSIAATHADNCISNSISVTNFAPTAHLCCYRCGSEQTLQQSPSLVHKW